MDENWLFLEKVKCSRYYLWFSSMCAKSLQSCPTLCNPLDSSPQGSSVHWTLQTRILKWVAMPSSTESSQTREWTHISCISLHWQAGYLPLLPPMKPFSRRDLMKMKVILGNTKDETKSLEFYQSKIHGFVNYGMPAQPNCLKVLSKTLKHSVPLFIHLHN